MTQIDTQTDSETAVEEVEIDPFKIVHKGECPSLSGRSTLEFFIGRHIEEGTLWLAITGNSAKGMFCKDWASAADIQEIVLGEEQLTAKSFYSLHEGRSINTSGFVMAALKQIGLIRTNEENTRLHSHASGITFEKAMAAYFAVNYLVPTKKPKKLKEA